MLKVNREEIKKIYDLAPVATSIFVWGRGFLSDRIRIFQKIESFGKMKDNDLDYDKPTHMEGKIGETTNISAEFYKVKLVEFTRLLDKDLKIALAVPVIDVVGDFTALGESLTFLFSKEGHKYDGAGFLSFIPRAIAALLPFGLLLKYLNSKRLDSKFAEFCSELQVGAIIAGGGKYAEPFKGVDPGKESPEEAWNTMLEHDGKIWKIFIYDGAAK